MSGCLESVAAWLTIITGTIDLGTVSRNLAQNWWPFILGCRETAATQTQQHGQEGHVTGIEVLDAISLTLQGVAGRSSEHCKMIQAELSHMTHHHAI